MIRSSCEEEAEAAVEKDGKRCRKGRKAWQSERESQGACQDERKSRHGRQDEKEDWQTGTGEKMSGKERIKKTIRQKKKLDFVQDFIPVKRIRHGIVETTDGRFIKILEIEPINFMLRSGEEQLGILLSFASWLKISPMRLQFKSITRKADSDRHVAMVRAELAAEESEPCQRLGEGYIRLIQDVGNREALTRRFFLIFQYEEVGRREDEDFSRIYSVLHTAEQNARAYFLQCGNAIVQPKDPGLPYQRGANCW